MTQDECGHGRGAGCNRIHGMPEKATGEAGHVKWPQSSGLHLLSIRIGNWAAQVESPSLVWSRNDSVWHLGLCLA